MLIHYIQRRMRLESFKVSASDELDWLGFYIEEGLYFEEMNPESYLRLPTYTTGIDDYFLHQARFKKKRHPKPQQQMPHELRLLLRRLEKHAPAGFIETVCSLLDANGVTRNAFVKLAAGRRKRCRKRPFSAFRMSIHDGVICYIAAQWPNQAMIDNYVEVVKHTSRVDHAVGLCEAARKPDWLYVSLAHYPWVPSCELDEKSQRLFKTLESTEFRPQQ